MTRPGGIKDGFLGSKVKVKVKRLIAC